MLVRNPIGSHRRAEKKPECEAQEIFNRLRSSDQPLAVLESMRQAEVLLPKPSTNTWDSDPRLAFFDQKAFESSVIQVPAKPWTTVAGDGIVSELITDFFTWDNSYMFPVLDRITFVDEMRAGDNTEVKWCSPLLVNAICAKRCLMVERGKQFDVMTGRNLSESFLAEAKSHFESEQGRPSIPAVQGLLLIYLTMTATGRDRAGLIYRLTAYEMLKQLCLEARIDENLILYTLLQDMPTDIPFGVPYSSTVKDLCIQNCRHDTDIIGSFIKKWPTNLMIAHQLYISMQTLVPILDDTTAQDLFTKSCRMAQLSSGSVRLSGVLLQATQAFVWAMDKYIPEPARQHLEGWTQETVDKDLPMSFALPSRGEVKEVLTSDESDQEYSVWNLGTLIEKWAILSMGESRPSS
ncbi:hypothetical protein H9Q72_001763 [Fusarium xylarioides]|uniref:Transcription factor domain-containing protein n=1 Tax=Fusarium xylarioides TaxID=221167 RepID=A0A9P7I7H7_9HYPO|nr:hypothetical protein H9Q72_001763 [Fusarium xylarioides]